jgi:hypothetical protein
MYGQALGALGGAPPMPPPAAVQGIDMGKPPVMPNMPPPPTGVGAMPVGDPSTTKKAAADSAILALRELKGHYPNLGGMVDSTIDAIKASAKGAAPKPGGAIGEPAALGTPPPATPATPLSGAPGAL